MQMPPQGLLGSARNKSEPAGLEESAKVVLEGSVQFSVMVPVATPLQAMMVAGETLKFVTCVVTPGEPQVCARAVGGRMKMAKTTRNPRINCGRMEVRRRVTMGLLRCNAANVRNSFRFEMLRWSGQARWLSSPLEARRAEVIWCCC